MCSRLTFRFLITFFAVVALGTLACSQRKGSFFEAQYYDTGDNYLVAAMESSSGNGKVVSFLSDLDSGLITEASVVDAGESPRAMTYYAGYLYVANYTSGSISVYSFARETGALTLVQTVTGLSQVSSLAVSTSYLVLYAGYSAGIQRYTIGADGLLSILGAPTVTAGPALQMVYRYGVNESLYVNSANTTLLTFSIGAQGALTSGSTVGFTNITSMALGSTTSETNSLLFVSDDGLDVVRSFSINATTGALTFKSSINVTDPKWLEYFPASPASLYVQRATGSILVYGQDDDGALTLSQTNTDVTETVVSGATVYNVSLNLWTIGQTNGICFWQYTVDTDGIKLKLARKHPLTAYGLYARQILGVVIQ